jgi:hypothetical protein
LCGPSVIIPFHLWALDSDHLDDVTALIYNNP